MRKIFFVILVIMFSSNLSSQEINAPDDQPITLSNKTDTGFNGAVRFMFSTSEFPLNLTFFDISSRIGYGIVPGFWYLGIAGDIAIGLDWFLLFSEDDEDSNEYDRELSQFGLSIGARIYNKIKLSNIDIIPFLGCDFMFVIIPLPYIGMEILYNQFGIEYAYYISNLITEEKLHQLSIKFRIPL